MKHLELIEHSLNMAAIGTPQIMREDSSSVGEWQPSEDAVEAMLIHKAALLEEYIRFNGRSQPPLGDRCQVLRQKIQSLEDDISKTGNWEAALQYLQNIPESHFQRVTRQDFVQWLDSDIATSPVMLENAANGKSSRKRKGQDSNDSYHAFSASSQNSSPDPSIRSKRLRTDGSEKPPCLRCRILKKKCDFLDQCRHCPSQGFENESDYWKVLGCFRGHLRDLSDTFCPAFSRSCQRTLVYRTGGIEIINFVLTKSRVSDQKRRRMLHLVLTRDDFFQLAESSWEDTARRESLALSGSSSLQHDDNTDSQKIGLEDYEAAWSALQAISMDRVYLTRTAYNLFTLLRLGNAFSRSDAKSCELFRLAKRLLRQSTELYLLERLCGQIASGDMIGKAPFDPSRSTPNTLVLVDLKEDVETFLRNFEKTCSGRAKLSGTAQIACFYALLVFGVAKSLFIDAYSIRTIYEDPNPWSEEEATKIASAYKVLVGVFCWASKTDVVLQHVSSVENGGARNQLLQTQQMVRASQWETFGFKGTKDFLLGLGTCSLPDGSYNGFFTQKFGLDELPTLILKPGAIDKSNSVECPEMTVGASPPSHETSPASTSTLDSSCAIFSIDERIPSSASPGAAIQPGSSDVASRELLQKKYSEVPRYESPIGSSPTTFTFVAHNRTDPHVPTRTHGGRKGALPPATLKKTREVRRVGACWNCWVMKMPCSEGMICQRCEKKGAKSPARCNRAPFAAYMDTLFPEWIISDFSTEAIKSYIATNTRGFTSQTMDVDVTSWADAFSMTLSVNYFTPIPDGSTQQTYNDKDGKPLGVESLPVGILDLDVKVLGDISLKKIDVIIQGPRFPVQILGHDSSNFSSLVFEILLDFYNAMAVKDKLIHDCFRLIATIRSINRPVLFTSPSATHILSQLQVDSPTSQLYSSRILNRQTKALSYHTSRLMTTKVLAQLEKTMRSRDKSLWPNCFAAMLLLTYCMEQMEVLARAHVQAARMGDPESKPTVEGEPEEYCELVDKGPYAQLSHLFHALYRTGKADNGGLNPLREDFYRQDDAGFDDIAMKMIRDIGEKVMNNVETLRERIKPLDFDVEQEEFAKKSSGRLMAKFLLSFI
ncbi:hypothetical protein BKA65DRAFT_511966 [Rhexocercosporidium sp. MPI-PUGE-AT-0058]|nr:hypothetical protein BKA65DRAFT_511966 [Rhexocercosporidium sp. MPI-PUGE-AT-0058]